MKQIVYGDVLFAVNFSMDFIALYLTSRIFHTKIKFPRLAAAAVGGAVYSVASLFIPDLSPYLGPLSGVFALLLDFGASALMCLAAFPSPAGKRPTAGGLAAVWAMFFGVELLLGGCMTALYNLFNKSAVMRDIQFREITSGAPAVYSDIPIWLLGLLVGASVIITYAGGKLLNRRRGIREAVVEISVSNNKTALRALVDSGNLLRDPISGKCAIITGIGNAAGILPPEIRRIIGAAVGTEALEGLDGSLTRRLRIIPASGVGHSGLLWGYIPDKIVVVCGGEHRCGEENRCGEEHREVDALLVFDRGGDCINGREVSYGGYDAIIPPELL